MEARSEEYVQRILDYLRSAVLLDPDTTIPLDQSLLEAGELDGIVDLLTFIETQFGISIPDADVTRENLGSVRKMGCYVAARARVAA